MVYLFKKKKTGMTVHTYNPSTRQAEGHKSKPILQYKAKHKTTEERKRKGHFPKNPSTLDFVK